MTTTYPVGYGTERVSMSELQRRFGPHMHPEFARRLWAWLESEEGRIGIGSGERSIATALRLWLSNPLRFANPRNSFHCQQPFPSGKFYAAVDLVAATLPPRAHRAPTWAEGDSAKKYGLHAFIRRGGSRPEPWHLQPIISRYGYATWGEGNQIRSASDWRTIGSPDLEQWPLPTNIVPPEPPTPPAGGTVINVTVPTIRKGDQGGWVRKMQAILTTFGQDVAVDGDFGQQSDAALRIVQSFMGTTSDGICGPNTWGILLGIAPD